MFFYSSFVVACCSPPPMPSALAAVVSLTAALLLLVLLLCTPASASSSQWSRTRGGMQALPSRHQQRVGSSSASRDGTPAPPPKQAPMTLLLDCNVWAPQPLGMMDILIGGTKILAMQHAPAAVAAAKCVGGGSRTCPTAAPSMLRQMLAAASLSGDTSLEALHMNGSIVLPGIIDPHVHVAGGGGEKGPASRVPPAQLSQLVNAGITTLVGLTGTDSITRSMPNLLQTLLGLADNGLTTYMFSGSYHVPVVTLTETIERDITLIEKIIGVGEIAISDHRGSWPSFQQLVELISNARVAGLLAGKAGVAHFHIGPGPTMLDPLFEVVNRTTIPITNMYPTHIERSVALQDQGIAWIKLGGFLDYTADAPGDNDTLSALLRYKSKGVDMSHVTLSSDAYGSLPVFDDAGNLLYYGVAMPDNVINLLRKLVLDYGWSIEEAFRLVTTNTADILLFDDKGRLAVGKDADILVLDPKTLAVQYVFARGAFMKTPTWVATGMFG